MLKNLFTIIPAGTMALFLITACAEEGKDASDTAAVKTTLSEEKTAVVRSAPDTEKIANKGNQGSSVMNQPVNFSTPEDVEKTLQGIREKEGDKAYNELKNTIQYLLVYDLSVSNNKQKLYKKLNGKTPEQIIAQVQR